MKIVEKKMDPKQGVSLRMLFLLLTKLGINKHGRIIHHMSMYKTMSCEPGEYKVSITIKEKHDL